MKRPKSLQNRFNDHEYRLQVIRFQNGLRKPVDWTPDKAAVARQLAKKRKEVRKYLGTKIGNMARKFRRLFGREQANERDRKIRKRMAV